MERTELREAFFAETRRDPYVAATFHLYVDAWVSGYERALRDLEREGVIDSGFRARKDFGERREDAAEFLTEEKRKSEAEALVALSTMLAWKPGAMS